MRAVYNELHGAVTSIDEQDDLRWWKNTHGPGMPTDWPHFQVCPLPGPFESRPASARQQFVLLGMDA